MPRKQRGQSLRILQYMEQIAGSIESYDNEDFDSMTKKELEIIQESMVDIIGLCQSLKTKVDNIIATK